MTRLQRWERADALGLNPPLAVSTLYALINALSHFHMQVKEILLDEQAKEGTTLRECVFFGEV